MHRGSARWAVLASAILTIASLFALPRFAATVVRAAIESESAADRDAFAAGGSPWSWRFRERDDVVAGRAFGAGRLEPAPGGLAFSATDGSAMEIGLPLTRPADVTRLDRLWLRAEASAPGNYAWVARETLSGPIRRAALGTLAAGKLPSFLRLDRLDWTDAAGRPAAPPTRAAMLRLEVRLPAAATFTLHEASLVAETGPIQSPVGALPSRLSAEGLLAWRDHARAADPLVTFGSETAAGPAQAGLPWLPPLVYLLVLGAFGGSVLRRHLRQPVVAASAARDLIDAGLVLVGPLWFIAGLGLSDRPDPIGVTMFMAGASYAFFLHATGVLPRWHWLGTWRAAGWPLLAVPAALCVVVFFGHAPSWPPLGRVAVYVGWALFQQWLMLAVVGALLERALPRPLALLLTALAFALLHTPNGLLMQLCFVAEFGWAWWYFHRRALLPVALAHALSAVLLQAGLAGGLLRSLEVSARFLG
ncbi:membrane protease YdiL (CAAX protease family) [Luteibacter jiangsuensis]|uniref:Membrane protease YdiL (CAAX protease family) n=1 Tax=Luteibacter jiangsuensis TaxID=637577 RepID=A0ABT9T2J2_9GAMM|nr:CPBP family glutamic-type intramembrane protease [Luteibacter jiangsuensis]MDQ0010407.1 membrane protease YdiL (CAAX protease family) [Luteibacter jiangsuensis]